MTCSRINIFRALASSRVRGTSFDSLDLSEQQLGRLILHPRNAAYVGLSKSLLCLYKTSTNKAQFIGGEVLVKPLCSRFCY